MKNKDYYGLFNTYVFFGMILAAMLFFSKLYDNYSFVRIVFGVYVATIPVFGVVAVKNDTLLKDDTKKMCIFILLFFAVRSIIGIF